MDRRRDSALIVFSHLRWDFVYQRPQHLLSRMATRRPVYFIEEPLHASDAEPHWSFNSPAPGVRVCRPHTPTAASGFADEQLGHLNGLVARLLADESIQNPLCWLYTPMALPLVNRVNPSVLVYDCMDELSLFHFAPPKLLEYEAELLRRADLVFTGGPSIYRAKKGRNRRVYCFPSSVDASHFGKAKPSAGLTEAPEQRDLPGPRLGYFGVIDERFDIPLLTELANARPDWQFVMVGPVVKIDPATLPRNPNVHYFGQQPYGRLPEFLAGWDVCLLPFARNDATRFISPTKTLEYMAAERPIVSTPITDVAEPYGDVVYLGDTPEAFLGACEQALHASPEERDTRIAGFRSVLARTSWDRTADEMNANIEVAHQASRGREPSGSSRAGDKRNPPVVVIGAGPTGLSAAYHLGEDALLLEQNDRVGGWCRSIVEDGFTFDFAGHIMFSNDPYVHELYGLLLGDNVHWQDREAWVYSKEVYTRYPFQGSLYGLPADVIKECIVGAIEARFGPVAPPAKKDLGQLIGHLNGNGHKNGACKVPVVDDKGDTLVDCCADGVAEAGLTLADASPNPSSEPRNFEEFIYKVWGAGIAKHFAIPYNRKIWAVPLDQMETSWLGGRVPMPDLGEMIEGALTPKAKPMGPNARFGYPLRGGFQALMDGFLPHLEGRLRLRSKIVNVSALRHTITLANGDEVPFEQLISTMPLPVLVRQLGDEVPEEVRRAAAGLRHTSVKCVNLGVGRENLTEKHWIYYPEDTVFHRIFVQGNASPHCNPAGGFGLTCEITYSPHKPLPCDGADLIRLCVEDCIRVGMIRREDAIWTANVVDMPHAYVVYDHARPKNVALVRDWLAGHDIHLAGRYSEWEYYNSDHAFLAGRKVAERVRKGRTVGVGRS